MKILLVSEGLPQILTRHGACSNVCVVQICPLSNLIMFVCPEIMLSCGIISCLQSSTPSKGRASYEQGLCLISYSSWGKWEPVTVVIIPTVTTTLYQVLPFKCPIHTTLEIRNISLYIYMYLDVGTSVLNNFPTVSHQYMASIPHLTNSQRMWVFVFLFFFSSDH